MPDRAAVWKPLRRASAPAVAVFWLLTKAIVYGLWFGLTGGVQGDVKYYARQLALLPYLGPRNVLIEYPLPVIPILEIPSVFAFGHSSIYGPFFVAFMFILDAAFCVLLWRLSPIRDGRRDALPTLYWTLFTALVGTIVAMRFDLIPAILAGGALIALYHRRPAVAGALIAVGACIKLWPAILVLALLGRRENRLRGVAGFLGTGAGVAMLCWAWAGWDRLVSPLTWQSDRGLQMESIWATVPMLQRAFGADYPVYVSRYQAFEIYHASPLWLTAASVATVVGGLAVLALAAWWLATPARRDLGVAAMLMLLITGVMIVTNKTFSPQYVIWLGGPLAVLLALPSHERRLIPPRSLRAFAVATLVIALLTQIIYPIGYDGLIWTDYRLLPMTLVLTVRNIAIVALVVWAGVLVGQAAHRSRRESGETR